MHWKTPEMKPLFTGLPACNFIKNKLPSFFCEYCEICKNNFFYTTLLLNHDGFFKKRKIYRTLNCMIIFQEKNFLEAAHFRGNKFL